MSIPFIRYFCPTCQQNAEVLRVTEPLRCSLCSQVICNKCEQFGLCPQCAQKTTPEERRKLGRKEEKTGKRGPGVVMGCSFILVLIFPMLVVGGFMSNTPLIVIIGFLGVIGCIISIVIASRIDKKRKVDYEKAKGHIAQELKKDLQSEFVACPNCGTKNESKAQFCGICGAKFTG